MIAGSTLAFMPQVKAGSEQDPEITDTEGDVPIPTLDVISAWFDNENSTHFNFSMKLKQLSGIEYENLYLADFEPSPSDGYFYEIRFYFELWINGYEPTCIFLRGEAGQNVGFHEYICDLNFTYNVEKGVITVRIPKAGLPESTVKLTNSVAMACTGISAGIGAWPEIDRAPDEGYGRDYEFTVKEKISDSNQTNQTQLLTTPEEPKPNFIPGFEGIALIAGIAIVSYLMRKR